jgi:hypothetical protein
MVDSANLSFVDASRERSNRSSDNSSKLYCFIRNIFIIIIYKHIMENNQNNLINKSYNKIMSINPTVSYENVDTQRVEILRDNKEKTGIYRWTHKESRKTYVGSAIILSHRFRNYYNISFLERETTKNNSMIYKALIKYGYSSFKLEILEYCDALVIIEREQYYLNILNPVYNILKTARSLKGFRHSKTTIELMRVSRLGRNCTENTKLKIAVANGKPVLVKNNNTGEITKFLSVRKASKFISKHYSYITKCLKKRKFYKGKEFTIYL